MQYDVYRNKSGFNYNRILYKHDKDETKLRWRGGYNEDVMYWICCVWFCAILFGVPS